MAYVTGLDHLNLTVKNLKNTTEFYKNIFGLEEKERGVWNGVDWKIIGKKWSIYLCLYEGKKELKESRLSHIGFNISNYQNFKNNLIARKIKFEEISYPRSQSLYVKDPDGLEVEVSSAFGGGLE